MTCKLCGGKGIRTIDLAFEGNVRLCRCEAGQNVLRFLTAVARGEPVGTRNPYQAGFGNPSNETVVLYPVAPLPR